MTVKSKALSGVHKHQVSGRPVTTRCTVSPNIFDIIIELFLLTYQKLNDLYSSPNILRVIKIENEMGGACSTYGERRGVYRAWVGSPGGKRPLGRCRRRWGDNIKMDKPTLCSWAVTFISLVYHSTCFGRFLHPSSRV